MSKIFDLKSFRKDYKLNQVEVAFLFECSQPNIAAIEKGLRTVTPKQINILKEKYGDISRYYIDETNEYDLDAEKTEPQKGSSVKSNWESLAEQQLEHIKKLTCLLEESQNENKKLIDTIDKLSSLLTDRKAV